MRILLIVRNDFGLHSSFALREDMSQGPAKRTYVRRGRVPGAADGLRSQCKIAAQERQKRGRTGHVLHALLTSTRFGKAR